MIKLLNRFAWLLSIILWFIISISVIGFDTFLLTQKEINYGIGLWIISALLIKKIILSKRFIKKALEYQKKKEQIENKIENIENLKKQEDIKNKHSLSAEGFSPLNESNLKLLNNNIKAENKNPEENKEEISESKIVRMLTSKALLFLEKAFFKDPLMKLGIILITLSIIYFYKSQVTDFLLSIGLVWRIIMTVTIISFIIYYIWVKIYSRHKNEAFIFMWISIIVNFIVILSYRYFVWINSDTASIMLFLLLTLNVFFWILTSLVYNSKTILVISFLFAYLNPFMLWMNNLSFFNIICYSIIINILWLLLSNQKNNIIFVISSFVLWAVLYLFIPFSNELWWNIKIISTCLLSAITLLAGRGVRFSLYNNIFKVTLFILTYIFIILNLINSSGMLSLVSVFVVYYIVLLVLYILSVLLTLRLKSWAKSFSIILFIPLILFIWLLFTSQLLAIPFVLLSTVIINLIWIIFLRNKFKDIFFYIFFCLLALFIWLFNFEIQILDKIISEDITRFSISLITSVLFLLSSYYYAIRKKAWNLFAIWTLWNALILSPVVINKVDFRKLWVDTTLFSWWTSYFSLLLITMIIFIISNWLLPILTSKILKKENFISILIWVTFCILLVSVYINAYWTIHFSLAQKWLAFLLLSFVYFTQSFFAMKKIWINNFKKDFWLQKIFYIFLLSGIFLFSLSVVLMFLNKPQVISLVLFSQATVLYYFYSKTKLKAIFSMATLFFLFWLWSFLIVLPFVIEWNSWLLTSFNLIIALYILDLHFFDKINSKILNIIHHILHIVWIWIVAFLITKVISNYDYGFHIFTLWIFSIIFGYLYAKWHFKFGKILFLIFILWFTSYHILDVFNILINLKKENLWKLSSLQYITTWAIILNLFVWRKFNKIKPYNRFLTILVWVYTVIITSIYTLDLFYNTFNHLAVTIYFSLISLVLLSYGIWKDFIKYRIFWLYFLLVTMLKIFFYDIWVDSVVKYKIISFILTWVIFIVVSYLYKKKYWSNLAKEFKEKKNHIFLKEKEKEMKKKWK